MKALVNTGPDRVELLERPTPVPGPGQVRIRTVACGICATDLEMIHGWERTAFGAIPGHEWSGIIDAVGSAADSALIGQPCVAENVLSDGGEVGFEHPGGYAQYLLTQARNVQLLPSDFPLHAGALIEPLAVCIRGLRRLRLENRTSALIIGDGSIGLIMLQLLKYHGVGSVTVVGARAARMELARSLGAAAVLDHALLASDVPGGPFPSVIEATGSAAGMAMGISAAARGGKILVVGDYRSARAEFPWNTMIHRELELIGTNASAGAWPEAVRMATTGIIPLARLISRQIPAEHGAEAIDLVRRSTDLIKIILDWN
jgi:L-iditol 2-dehydrogenase